ncbi:MAG TPA: LpxD N-terminal domain-containing protein, partial [Burkholderiales bacterium]|nr:LpxD N-terminal domain-containing protein [Burkholderiales bacterium]
MTRSKPESYSLSGIRERFGGEIAGDPATEICQVATLESATPACIAFFANERYLPQLKTTRAGAVIVGESARHATRLPRIVCTNPYAYFARVSALLNPDRPVKPGVHASAVVDATATIPADAEIGPCAVVARNAKIGTGCVIGAGCHVGDGTVIGSGSRLYPNVTVYHDCLIG